MERKQGHTNDCDESYIDMDLIDNQHMDTFDMCREDVSLGDEVFDQFFDDILTSIPISESRNRKSTKLDTNHSPMSHPRWVSSFREKMVNKRLKDNLSSPISPKVSAKTKQLPKHLHIKSLLKKQAVVVTIMSSNKASKEMCKYCFDSLVLTLNNGEKPKSPSFPNSEYPLFVTWHKRGSSSSHYSLRGCIGTFSPQPIHHGLHRYSLISAFEDGRFSPMQVKELPHLKCSISLLVDFEEAKDVLDWEIGIHGIRIEFTHPKSGRKHDATYLPEVCSEQGWDKLECLSSLYNKAGFIGAVTKDLMSSTKLIRYKSSKCSLTYDEYVNMK